MGRVRGTSESTSSSGTQRVRRGKFDIDCVKKILFASMVKYPSLQGFAASQRLSSEMQWASCWCSTWPISKVLLTSGTGWVCCVFSFPSCWFLSLVDSQFQVDWSSFPGVYAGQLQANAYCDNPDVVLVGTKADIRDTRNVNAKLAREMADRYGWVETDQSLSVRKIGLLSVDRIFFLSHFYYI